jgi:flagellar hook protein FlgE
MASFFIPLTGLQSDSVALNTIANNLANISTTGYKASTTKFSDLFYENLGTTGSGDPVQLGSGVQVASNSTSYTSGSISSTSNDTDMALNGEGFFVVQNNDGTNEYTRAGDFSLSSTGVLETSSGSSVMGYPATDGVVNTSSALSAITIPVGQTLTPKATSTLSMTTNLDSSASTGDTYPAEATVYDSLGDSHTLTVTYTKTGTNTWSYSAELPASDYTSGTSTAVTGTLTFDSSGTLTSITPSSGSTTTVGTASGDSSSISLGFSGLADGASDLSIKWNLLGSSDTPTVSQVDSTSTLSASTQDGYSSGTYESFSVASDGTVSATYSNGKTQDIGQLAVATVANEQGLTRLGDGNYQTTNASGTASIGTADNGGRASVEDDALEGSNVDISTQFSELIIAQRAFEANSKAVTTFDTVIGDTISLIR